MDAWILNTYVGCDIRCVYCIVSAQGRSVPRAPREQVAARLAAELDRFETPPRIGVGAYTDVYPQVEADYGVTRPAIQLLVERKLPFTVVTKGSTVLRDIDLYAAHPHAEVQISLCSVDDDALRRLDPGAPSAAERLDMLHQLFAAGVEVRLQVSSWIPGVTDIAAVLDRVNPSIRVTTTPLRVPPHIRRTPFGRQWNQSDINVAFRQEYERVGERHRLRWSRPPAEDGAPPHIEDNVGRGRVDDWRPAPPTPRPGPDPDDMPRAAAPARVELLRTARRR